MTNPNVRHKIASADATDQPVFDAGPISKMAADPPTLLDLEARLPPPPPKKLLKLRLLSPEAYDRRERAAHAKANSRYYRGRVVVGSSSHRAAERIRNFARDSGLSVAGGFLSLRDRSAGQKLLDQADAAAPKPRPPVPAGIRVCAHCHEKLPYRMRAGAEFCSEKCKKSASRDAKRAAIEAAEKVFRTDQLIAANSAQSEALTPAELARFAACVRLQELLRSRENKGPYVRPECGRKAANSYC